MKDLQEKGKQRRGTPSVLQGCFSKWGEHLSASLRYYYEVSSAFVAQMPWCLSFLCLPDLIQLTIFFNKLEVYQVLVHSFGTGFPKFIGDFGSSKYGKAVFQEDCVVCVSHLCSGFSTSINKGPTSLVREVLDGL